MAEKINRITKSKGQIVKSTVPEPARQYVNVRLKDEIYQPIAMLAAQEGRTVTAQVNFMLSKALQAE